MSSRVSFTMKSALGGAAVWATVALLAGTGHAPFGIIELLFLFAPLVIVPLGLELDRAVIPEAMGGADRLAERLQPAAAGLAVVAFWLPPGRAAALISLPWACVCGVVALSSALDFVSRRFSLPRLLAHVGRLDLLIGAGWLLVSRFGARPQDFQEPIILLTAVHFHFSGFGLATIAAASLHTAQSRSWRSGLLALSAALVVFLPFLVAAGFVFSPALKVTAAVTLALSVITFSAVIMRFSSKLVSRTARVYLRAAAVCVFIGMALAVVYAVSDYLGEDWLVIPLMASTHGVLNGLGFILPGLLGWLAEWWVSGVEVHHDLVPFSSQPFVDVQRYRVVEADSTNLTFSARDFYDR